jgi:hypothetical protein
MLIYMLKDDAFLICQILLSRKIEKVIIGAGSGINGK